MPPAPEPTPTAPTTPTFKYVAGKEYGCGNVFLYKGTADEREVLWIEALKLYTEEPTGGTRTHDVSDPMDGVRVGVDLWEKDGLGEYCNEFAGDRKQVTWRAKKGTVAITITDVLPAVSQGLKYNATARLEGVDFENAAGKRATLKQETIRASVYWTRIQ